MSDALYYTADAMRSGCCGQLRHAAQGSPLESKLAVARDTR
jgi:hypothetical protein